MVTRTSIPAHSTNYYVGRRDEIKYIVIHTGETDEGSTPAEGMGNWFATDHGAGRRSSAHRGADTDSICTYIADANTAFGAPGVNASGWHLEHAGRAGQTNGQWDDAASRLILANGALAAAEASKRLGIPARWLTDAELRAGSVKGFITHAQASRVLGGTHWDPGPNFPADRYMALVRSHLDGPTTPAPKEFLMALDDKGQQRVLDAAERILATVRLRYYVPQADGSLKVTSDPKEVGARRAYVLDNIDGHSIRSDAIDPAELAAAVKAEGVEVDTEQLAAALAKAITTLATKETP